jgi:hypothetical protein
MVALGEIKSSRRATRRRAHWLWLVLLCFAGCSLPKYSDYAQTRPADAGNDTGTEAGLDSGAGATAGAGAGGGAEAGAGACDGGDCTTPTCPLGLGNCNGSAADGCETTLDSKLHCGGCDVECTNAHGTTVCAGAADAGAACSPTCAASFADCDLNPDNGCETNINTDSTHCGHCGFACPANGGTPLCQAGRCGVSACNAGFGDCANVGSCDQNLNTDPNNCGHCGHVCSTSHGTATCNAGNCQIACDTGYGDCNVGDLDGGVAPDDGCETKLNVQDSNGNIANCGSCGATCNRRSFTSVSVAQCVLGVCSRDCFAGEGDCDNNRDDPACTGKNCGCETALGADVNNCGACAHVCKGGTCANDTCACPDTKPTSGSTKCTLAGTVKCGTYATSCSCSCTGGVFVCTDSGGKAC